MASEAPTSPRFAFRSEAREVRPFADLGDVLGPSEVSFARGGEFMSGPTVPVSSVNRANLSLSLRVPRLSAEDLGDLGLRPEDLQVVVVVEDGRLKKSVPILKQAFGDLPETLELTQGIDDFTWSAGTKIHLAVVLATQRPAVPGQAYRKGTWLTSKTFSLIEPPQFASFDPISASAADFKAMGLPERTPYAVRFRSDDLTDPTDDAADLVEVLIEKSLFESLAGVEETPVGRLLLAMISADVLADIVAKAIEEQGEDPIPAKGLAGAILDRLAKSGDIPRDRIEARIRESGRQLVRAIVQSDENVGRQMIQLARKRGA